MKNLFALLVLLSSTGVILPAAAGPANADTHRSSAENDKSSVSATSSPISPTSKPVGQSSSSAHRIIDIKSFTRGGHSKSALAQVTTKPTPQEATVKPNNIPSGIPGCYSGTVMFTQYWISKENSWDETNDGRRVWLGMEQEERLVNLKDETIAIVSSNTFEKCTMEGTVSLFFIFFILQKNAYILYS
jgi:hypothetical protein